MQSSASNERDILAYTGETPSVSVDSVGQLQGRPARHPLARNVVNALIVSSVIVVMLGPAIIFLIALTWGVVTYARSIILLVGIAHARNLAGLGPQLHELNIAVRLALLSAGYFALVFSLIVVYAGAMAHDRRRVSLVPGVLLVLPSIVVYAVGAVLVSASVTALTGIPIPVEVAVFLYILFDAFALGALLADTRRPVRRVRRFMRRRRYFLWQRMPYYSQRLHSRYEVLREALVEMDSPADVQPEQIDPHAAPDATEGAAAQPGGVTDQTPPEEDEPDADMMTVA